MQRLLSIVLFVLLLYNAVGYSITYLWESNPGDSGYGNIVKQELDSPNIIIKVPANSADQKNGSASEDNDNYLDGKGQSYQIQTRQVMNDTLYLYCKLDLNARERFMHLISKINLLVDSEAADSTPNSHAHLLKNFLKEYLNTDKKLVLLILEWETDFLTVNLENTPLLFGVKPAVSPPPPDFS